MAAETPEAMWHRVADERSVEIMRLRNLVAEAVALIERDPLVTGRSADLAQLRREELLAFLRKAKP